MQNLAGIKECDSFIPAELEAAGFEENMKITWYEMQPNEMFPAQITALIRAAKTSEKVACAACGKKRRAGLWTMLTPFSAALERGFTLEPGPELAPLTLICSDHPLHLAPRFMDVLRGESGEQTSAKS